MSNAETVRCGDFEIARTWFKSPLFRSRFEDLDQFCLPKADSGVVVYLCNCRCLEYSLNSSISLMRYFSR